MQNKFINSCFNYTGNKYKEMPVLAKIFPKHCQMFIDAFCGSGTVGINSLRMQPDRVVLNDKDRHITDMLTWLKNTKLQETIKQIKSIIHKYNLSDTAKRGYSYYAANSSSGLGKVNKPGFLALRKDYNNAPTPKLLFVLMLYSFNNQIRFNKSRRFNMPVGKRDFNKAMQKKLAQFAEKLQDPRIIIINKDYKNLAIPQNAFVYCDPPYTITNAVYNRNWTNNKNTKSMLSDYKNKNDAELFAWLDKLNQRHIKFALSDMLLTKGKINTQLAKWHHKYNMHQVSFNYNHSNYHAKKTQYKTQEIIVTNY